MELIVVAYKKEAQSIIRNLHLEKTEQISPFLYSNKNTSVLICGKGVQNVKKTLSSFLKIQGENISRIINTGIAGKLNDSVKLFEVYPIKKVGLYTDVVSTECKNLEISEGAKSCITSLKPVSNYRIAQTLSPFADIVDMELWSITELANKHNIPVWAYKLISDDARYPVAFDGIKSKMALFSEKLFDYYINISFN